MAHRSDARALFDNQHGYSGTLIHNVNPAHLLEKPVRDRIVDSYYWKERCFSLNEATLCDRAAELNSLGGTYGISQRPTPFLCLLLKLLQLTPSRGIVLEYLNQPDFKYLTALAAMYIRLTFPQPKEVFSTLEPLLSDGRKLRRRDREGRFVLTFLDQFVDDLLVKDRVCATSLRKLPARMVLEDLGLLEVRVSALGDEVEEIDRISDGSAGEGESDIEEGEQRYEDDEDEGTRGGRGLSSSRRSRSESEDEVSVRNGHGRNGSRSS